VPQLCTGSEVEVPNLEGKLAPRGLNSKVADFEFLSYMSSKLAFCGTRSGQAMVPIKLKANCAHQHVGNLNQVGIF